MRKLQFFIFLTAVVFLLCSCSDSDKTADVPSGYTLDAVSGGKAAEDININALEITGNENSASFAVSFTKGSSISSDNASDISYVPEYEVSVTGAPYSIVISVPGVCYTDFLRTVDYGDAPGINGVFFDECASAIRIQLAYDAAFMAVENGNVLTVSVAKTKEQHGSDEYAYYVTSNTYDYCRSGFLTIDSMTPIVTREGEVIMISGECADTEEAQEQLSAFKSKYPEYADSFEVIAMYYDTLPIYNPDMDNAKAYSEQTVRRGNKVQTAKVFIPDGYYLTETQEGVVYEKSIYDGENSHSEIYLKGENGSERLFKFEFSNVERVEMSGDGRKMAVLENATTGSHLYVFDIMTRELLYDLSDAGLGKRVCNFLWNDLGNAIYAISGTDSIAINMYDFSITDETKRTSTIYSGTVDEGSFGIYGGELYFSDTNENGSTIYSVKPEIGARNKFADGSAFVFSNDLAAVTTASTVATMEEGEYGFYVIDMESGEQKTVTEAFAVFTFKWSDDGKKLYYVENRISGSEADTGSESDVAETVMDEFPYTLHVYDVESGKSTAVCDMKYGMIDVCGKGALIKYYDAETDGQKVRATYLAE